MKSEVSTVIKKMEAVNEDTFEFDDLISAWNKLCEKAGNDDNVSSSFEDIANSALTTMSNDAKKASLNNIEKQLGRMLDSFPHATYMVNVDGFVTAYNAAAFEKYDLNTGVKIDTLPFVLTKAESISSHVSKLLESEAVSTQSILKQIYNESGKHEGTIAVTPSGNNNKSALIFVIGVKWQTESLGLIQQQFELTNTEVAILQQFVDGNSLHDIAAIRSRSYATIRTQFQSLLTKTESSSQTELLRTVLSVSEFVSDINHISNTLNHPHRRRAELFIEGGRIIEVTFMGDFNGEALVCCTDALTYTFNADFEQALFDNNLYFISICFPGFGATDSVPTNENRLERIANDIESVLNQLNIDHCPIVSCNTASPIAAAMTNQIPHKISHVFMISSSYPFNYWLECGTQSPWADAVLSACTKHQAIKKFILRNGIKAWPAMGATRFMKLQISSDSIDAQYFFTPEMIKEYDKSLQSVTKHGPAAFYEDLCFTFSDWSEEINKSNAPFTVIHGIDNAVFPIEGVRALTEDYSEKIDLIEIEDAGFTLHGSHSAMLAELLKQKIKQQGRTVSTTS